MTHICLEHTCGQTTNSHRVAVQKSGQAQPNIDGVNDVVSILQDRPLFPMEMLWPLLTKYLPFYHSISLQFAANFCWRMQLWIIQNRNRSVLRDDVNYLSQRRKIAAANEELVDDSAFCQQNLTNLLRNAMQHAKDAGTWHAHAFLEKLCAEDPGFDFCIHRDQDHNPDGICWILPQMRSDLLWYGTSFFLDCKKTQYNRFGWPYIGPCVKDNNM